MNSATAPFFLRRACFWHYTCGKIFVAAVLGTARLSLPKTAASNRVEKFCFSSAKDGFKMSDITLAAVAAVYGDGIRLIFDGAASKSKKHCKRNTAVKYPTGDGAKICKNFGTDILIGVL